MKIWQLLKKIRHANQLSWFQLGILLAFFCTLSFGQLSRVEWSAPVYFHDCLIGLWLISTHSIWISSLRKKIFRVNWKEWWLLPTFILWLILGIVLATIKQLDFMPWLYLLRLVVYSIFLFSLSVNLRKSPLLMRILLVCTGIYMVWFGLIYYVLIPDSRYLFLLGWDEHYYRLIGPLLDPNLSGILYLIIGWAIFSLRSLLPKKLLFFQLIVIATAIILTYSRATYLAGIVSIFSYWLLFMKPLAILKRYGLPLLILLICAIGIYLIAPKPGGEGINLFRTASITARLETSKTYISSLDEDEWLTGAGLYSSPNNQNYNSHARVPDNILVLILTSSGIIGLTLFFTLFTKLQPIISRWEPEVIAALVAISIHAQFNNSFLEPFIFLCLGVLIISQHGSNKNIEKNN